MNFQEKAVALGDKVLNCNYKDGKTTKPTVFLILHFSFYEPSVLSFSSLRRLAEYMLQDCERKTYGCRTVFRT